MNRISYFGILTAVAIGVISCKGFKGGSVTVNPNPLEVHADSVKFTVRASVAPKSGFKKGGEYNGKLVIKNGADNFTMDRVRISSEKYPDIKKSGAQAKLNVAQVYNEKMDGGNLVAQNQYTRKSKTIDLPETQLAPCCITTSRLVYEADKYITLENKHEHKSSVPVSYEAKFQFPQDVFKIRPTEYEKQEIKNIGEMLSKKIPATSVTIAGFASPEGPLARNRFLSIARSKEVKKWLEKQLKDNGYTVQLDSTFFNITTTSEDWEGFKANLYSMPYTEDVKSKIIEIVSAGYEEDEKERRIMALVGGARRVEEILAPLRRATIRIEGSENKLSDAEIDALANQAVTNGTSLKGKLEKEDFLFAISRQENLQAKKALLKQFVDAYPDDYRGLNDLAVIYLKEGLTDEAFPLLTKANQAKPNNHAIMNNLGVAYKNKKNLTEAKNYYQSSMSAMSSAEVTFNIAVIDEKMAQYPDAAEKFNAVRNQTGALYNAGLCKLLMGDLAGAKTDLESATRVDPNFALTYYVLAIVGARSSDTNLLVSNLKKAVSLDSKLADKAYKDLEFLKYKDNAEFKAALK